MSETTPQPEVKSENLSKRSRAPMQLVGEREVAADQTRPMMLTQPPTTPPPAPRMVTTAPSPDVAEVYHRAAWRAGVLGAVNAITMVLAARFLVLVAVAGAIFLAWTVVQSPDPYKLSVLGIYMVAVIATVWLAAR